MKITSAFLLCGIMIQTSVAHVIARQDSDEQVSAQYKTTGQCFGYFVAAEDTAGYGLQMCITWCKAHTNPYQGAMVSKPRPLSYNSASTSSYNCFVDADSDIS
jgi:hypothetical protein